MTCTPLPLPHMHLKTRSRGFRQTVPDLLVGGAKHFPATLLAWEREAVCRTLPAKTKSWTLISAHDLDWWHLWIVYALVYARFSLNSFTFFGAKDERNRGGSVGLWIVCTYYTLCARRKYVHTLHALTHSTWRSNIGCEQTKHCWSNLKREHIRFIAIELKFYPGSELKHRIRSCTQNQANTVR